jgi:hypothetical protein
MPKYIVRSRTEASSDSVWPLVSDLTRHVDWSADPLTVTAKADGTYESVATSKGKQFRAALTVTESVPKRRFAFRATDPTGTYEHVFTLEQEGAETVVTREITAIGLTPAQLALYYVALPIVKKPSAQRSLDRLAAVAATP